MIEIALNQPFEQARDEVFRQLADSKLTEAQFHDAIEEYATALSLTSEQWLRLFQMYKSPIFHSRFDLPRLLSENHIKQLMES